MATELPLVHAALLAMYGCGEKQRAQAAVAEERFFAFLAGRGFRRSLIVRSAKARRPCALCARKRSLRHARRPPRVLHPKRPESVALAPLIANLAS